MSPLLILDCDINSERLEDGKFVEILKEFLGTFSDSIGLKTGPVILVVKNKGFSNVHWLVYYFTRAAIMKYRLDGLNKINLFSHGFGD